MIKFQRLYFSLLLVFVVTVGSAIAVPIEISKEFNLFTSNNLKGYTKPFFTSLQEGINSNIFTTATYRDNWSFGLDISVSGMFIPNSQTTYEADRPDMYGNTSVVKTAEIRDNQIINNMTKSNLQPTVYGGASTAIFAAPQNHKLPDSMYKSVAYVEGNEINFMSGLPTIQLNIGLPTRTEFRFRFLVLPVQNEALVYWGLMAKQNIDKLFDLFDQEDRMGLAVHLGLSKMSRDGIDLTALVFGAHFSKAWDNGIAVYTGLQFENMTGKFESVRKNFDPKNVGDSPYLEVRQGKALAFDIDTYTAFKLLGGISYKTGAVELHGDIGWASQPILTAGICFNFAEFGEGKDKKYDDQLEKQKQNKKK